MHTYCMCSPVSVNSASPSQSLDWSTARMSTLATLRLVEFNSQNSPTSKVPIKHVSVYFIFPALFFSHSVLHADISQIQVPVNSIFESTQFLRSASIKLIALSNST